MTQKVRRAALATVIIAAWVAGLAQLSVRVALGAAIVSFFTGVFAWKHAG